jgi:hypothetical protein
MLDETALTEQLVAARQHYSDTYSATCGDLGRDELGEAARDLCTATEEFNRNITRERTGDEL